MRMQTTQGRSQKDIAVALGVSAATVSRLLKRAMECAAATGGGRIGATHMLVGALDAKLGRVPRALEIAGADRAALRARAAQAAEEGDH